MTMLEITPRPTYTIDENGCIVFRPTHYPQEAAK